MYPTRICVSAWQGSKIETFEIEREKAYVYLV